MEACPGLSLPGSTFVSFIIHPLSFILFLMKVSVYIGTGLDGFIAREDGGLDWLMSFADDEAIKLWRGKTTQQNFKTAFVLRE
jgi:hypothetical protein